MGKERRRLLIPPGRLAQEMVLTAPEAHYLGRVLRLSKGQACDVVDGAGHRWGALLVEAGRLRLEQPLAQPLERQAPGDPALSLAVALPKQEAALIWRMATELGMDHLQPLLAERCCMGARRCPEERWQAILREATEQCERLWLPVLEAPMTALDFFSPADGRRSKPEPCNRGPSPIHPSKVHLPPPQPSMTPNSGGGGQGDGGATTLNLLASSRGDAWPHWGQILAPTSGAQRALGSVTKVCIAIGPEGGWSPEEEAAALAHGWIPVRGGATILRTATAAVAAATWLAGWRSGLSSSSTTWQSP